MKGFIQKLFLLFSFLFASTIQAYKARCDIGNFDENGGACADVNRPPGLAMEFYWLPVDEILTMPTILPAVAPGDTMTYADDLVYNPPAVGPYGWRKIKAVVDTGEFTYDEVGEKGSTAIDNSFKFRLAGTSRENREFYDKFRNVQMVLLIKTREQPDYPIMLGTKDFPAEVKELKGTTGTKVGEGYTGAMFTIKDTSGRMAKSYPYGLQLYS